MVDKKNKLDFIDDDFSFEEELKNNLNANDDEVFQDPEYNANLVDNENEVANDMDEYTVRIFGLDNSGKTLLMMNLIDPKEDNIFQVEPTTDSNADTYIYKETKFNFWDISGAKDNRENWKSYFHYSDGFIFVVDVSDKVRLDEAKKALNEFIMPEVNDGGIPLLIYANKNDKLNKSVEGKDVLESLGVKANDNLAVQVCSAKTFKGLKEGFDWLFGKIKVYS